MKAREAIFANLVTHADIKVHLECLPPRVVVLQKVYGPTSQGMPYADHSCGSLGLHRMQTTTQGAD